MTISRKILYLVLALVMAIVITGILNFLLQLLIALIDPIMRISASGLYVVVLWIVTGIFCSVLTFSLAEPMLGKENADSKFIARVIIIISIIMIVFSLYLIYDQNMGLPVSEFSLLFSNPYILLSFFIGVAGMSFILRRLNK